MRPSLFIIAALVVISYTAGNASAEKRNVDRIIQRYVVAIGADKALPSIRNLYYSGGQYREGEFEIAAGSMSVGRPNHKLVGDKTAPGDFMEGYDGSAWEWFADPGVVIRTVGAASAAARHYAGVEPPLVNYREKGSRARLLGTVDIDGKPSDVIELTRRDGFVEQFYIDQSSSLIVATGSAAPIHAFGETVQKLTRIGDYRRVGGMLIPHQSTTVEMPSGRTLWSMQWTQIEANRDLPPDWFSPPVFERSPLQSFIEHLYAQRDDLTAVEWTYDNFRRAYPDVDTRDAVDFAGFQILKMGQQQTAIALLERNVVDHPKSADSRYELARALLNANRERDARVQLDHALELDPAHKKALKAVKDLESQQ